MKEKKPLVRIGSSSGWTMIRGIGGLTVYSRIILLVQPPVKELPTFPFLGFYSHNVTARHGIKKEAPSCAWRKNTSLISSSSITFSCYLQKGAARSVPRLQPHGLPQIKLREVPEDHERETLDRWNAKKTRTVPSWVFLRYRNSTFISSLYLSTVEFLDFFTVFTVRFFLSFLDGEDKG